MSSPVRAAPHSPVPAGASVLGASGATTTGSGVTNIKTLIEQKERELTQMNDYRFSTLEALLQTKDREIAAEKQKLKQVKADFDYNLGLLSERDAELEKYDNLFMDLKQQLRDKDGAMSDLKVQQAEMQSKLKAETSRANDIEKYFQQKVGEMREQLDSTQWQSEDNQRRLREEFDASKRQLQQALREREEQIEMVRRDLTSHFESMLKQKEDSMRRLEETHNEELSAKNAQIQMHTKNLETLQHDKADMSHRIELLEQTNRDLEKKVKMTHWELEDASRLKDARILELEEENRSISTAKAAMLDEYENKMAELLQNLQSVERSMAQQREDMQLSHERTLTEKQRDFDEMQRSLKAQLESQAEVLSRTSDELENEKNLHKRHIWENEDAHKEKDRDHEQVVAEKDAHLDALSLQVKQLQNDVWMRDAELLSLREKRDALKNALEGRRGDIDALKNEILSAADRENELKREILEQSLQWEAKLEERERKLASQTDDLVATTQKQRDEATVSLREAERRINMLESELEHANSEMGRLRAQTSLQSSRDKLDTALANVDRERARLLQLQGVHSPSAASSYLPAASPLPSPNSLFPPTPGSRAPHPYPQPHAHRSGGGYDQPPEEMIRENERLRQQVADLERQNEKIRSVISDMRSEMETLQGTMQPPSAALVRDKQRVEDELERQREYSELLQRRLEEQSRGGDGVPDVSEVVYLRSRARELGDENARLRKEVLDGQVDAARGRASVMGNLESSASAGTQSLLDQRKNRIDELQGEVDFLLRECDNLRLQLRGKTEAASRAERHVSEVEHDNVVLKEKVRILETENGQLREKIQGAAKDLHRVMGEREKVVEISNTLRGDLDRLMSSSAVGGAGGGGSGSGSFSDREIARRYQTKIDDIEQSMRDLVEQNHMLRSELNRSEIRRSLSPQRGRSAVRSTSPYRARTKLAIAQESLALAGVPASVSERRGPAVSAASKGTASQTAARLKNIRSLAKKRAELVPQRRAVRNYNDR